MARLRDYHYYVRYSHSYVVSTIWKPDIVKSSIQMVTVFGYIIELGSEYQTSYVFNWGAHSIDSELLNFNSKLKVCYLMVATNFETWASFTMLTSGSVCKILDLNIWNPFKETQTVKVITPKEAFIIKWNKLWNRNKVVFL